MSIINLNGQVVYQLDDLDGGKLRIERGDLEGGIYILEIRGSALYREKVIIR